MSTLAEDINLVSRFLARRDRDAIDPVDVLVVPGNHCLETVRLAHLANPPVLVFAGGVGHSTAILREVVALPGDSEAELMLAYYRSLPPEYSPEVLLDTTSTNTGGNAREARRLLAEAGKEPREIGLIQDPLMQRRTHATFERVWQGTEVRFLSFAPFVPAVGPNLEPDPRYRFARMMEVLMGEIPRLRDAPGGYGPNGADFIVRVQIPDEVECAFGRLVAAFPEFAGR